MPELAEVEYYAARWRPALGSVVRRLHLRPEKRVFRTAPDAGSWARLITGNAFQEIHTHGKRMLFRFGKHFWLQVHLGMAGRLEFGPPETTPAAHDHLVVYTAAGALVFNDYRMFGELRLHQSDRLPDFWQALPPQLNHPAFTRARLGDILIRHARAPAKAVLLRQEHFPGIGNWMADEVLWRARLHPACPAGRIVGRKLSQLHAALREVVDDALRVIAPNWSDPPDTWLFNHRWRDGGTCPRSGKPLVRTEIGGRTTCFSPAYQTWPRDL